MVIDRVPVISYPGHFVPTLVISYLFFGHFVPSNNHFVRSDQTGYEMTKLKIKVGTKWPKRYEMTWVRNDLGTKWPVTNWSVQSTAQVGKLVIPPYSWYMMTPGKSNPGYTGLCAIQLNGNRWWLWGVDSVTNVTVWHRKACREMPNSYPEWRNFQSHRTTIIDSFSCVLFLRRYVGLLDHSAILRWMLTNLDLVVYHLTCYFINVLNCLKHFMTKLKH